MDRRFEQLLVWMEEHGITDVHISVEKGLHIDGRSGCGFLSFPAEEGDEKLLNYLLFRSGLDLAGSARPCSGAFEYAYRGEAYSFRFAYLKTGRIRSGVLRMLRQREPIPLERIFLRGKQRALIRQWCRQDHGIILISGPTGSGKTTTAYSLLGSMKDRKVYTLEDPVEVYQKGIVQIQVSREAGLGYAEGIRQLLRHDPDVIMIGEIRDEETAHMAYRSALTGHLVVTTIHSSDCAMALRRIQELGISAYDLEDLLVGVSSQRLVTLRRGNMRASLYELRSGWEMFHREGGSEWKDEVRYAAAKGWISADEAKRYLA